jgi:hypothetical protein
LSEEEPSGPQSGFTIAREGLGGFLEGLERPKIVVLGLIRFREQETGAERGRQVHGKIGFEKPDGFFGFFLPERVSRAILDRWAGGSGPGREEVRGLRAGPGRGREIEKQDRQECGKGAGQDPPRGAGHGFAVSLGVWRGRIEREGPEGTPKFWRKPEEAPGRATEGEADGDRQQRNPRADGAQFVGMYPHLWSAAESEQLNAPPRMVVSSPFAVCSHTLPFISNTPHSLVHPGKDPVGIKWKFQ